MMPIIEQIKENLRLKIIGCCPGTKCGELHTEPESGTFANWFS